MLSIFSVLIISLTWPLPLVARSNIPAEPKWRKIVLMRSTRDEVEKLLGHSQYEGFYASYPVEDGSSKSHTILLTTALSPMLT